MRAIARSHPRVFTPGYQFVDSVAMVIPRLLPAADGYPQALSPSSRFQPHSGQPLFKHYWPDAPQGQVDGVEGAPWAVEGV